MRLPKSKLGLTLSLLYLLGSIFFITSQGLFGESFIAVILGLPWSFFGIYLRYSQNNSLFHLVLYLKLLVPIVVNIVLLYWIGAGIQRLFSRRESK